MSNSSYQLSLFLPCPWGEHETRFKDSLSEDLFTEKQMADFYKEPKICKLCFYKFKYVKPLIFHVYLEDTKMNIMSSAIIKEGVLTKILNPEEIP